MLDKIMLRWELEHLREGSQADCASVYRISLSVFHFPPLCSISQSASPYVCGEKQQREEEKKVEDYNLLMSSRETPS